MSAMQARLKSTIFAPAPTTCSRIDYSAMMKLVQIQNYRGFQKYVLSGLATVNLLVGKNNSGKTALLESIHFLASGGDPSVLVNSASHRGEVVPSGREDPSFLDVSHLFYGHDVR